MTNMDFPKRVKTLSIGEGEPIIIEVEVPKREAPPYKKDADFKHIGKSYPRLEAFDKVTGRAKFAGDVSFPGMVHGKLLRSSKAKAEIKSIDTSAAERMPGFLGFVNMDIKVTRFAGDILGAVAAKTEQQVEDAVRMIKVEYNELPHVVEMREAMKSGASKVHDRDNIVAPRPYLRGDIEAGLKEADKVIKAEYKTQVEIHQPMEPHTTVLEIKGDSITVFDATQTITPSKGQLAGILKRDFPELKIAENKIFVICDHCGGGFGSKIVFNNHIIPQLKLAVLLKKPIKMVLNRYEQSVDAGNRPDSIQKYTFGVKKNGVLTGLKLEGYSSGGISRGDNLLSAIRDMYKCPNVSATSQTVFTNTGAGKATRAPGHPQAAFGFEGAMDEAAYAIGMDPLELRRVNYSYKNAGDTGLPYSSKALMQCYELGAQEIGWKNRSMKPGVSKGRFKRGLGCASGIWYGVGEPNTTVEVDIFRDGSINVRTGTQDAGTGTRTIMAQVAAEEFGVGLYDVNIQIGTTAYPAGSPSWGSLTVSSVMPAVKTACMEAMMKLFPIVASELECEPEDLECVAGTIRLKDDKETGLNFKAAAAKLSEDRVMGQGKRRPNPPEYAGNTFAAHFTEVEVDTLTGVIKVIKVVAAHDSGRIINPMTSGNQVIGAVNQSVSYAVMEGRVMDRRTGRMTNPDLHNYKLIPSSETPEIKVIFADSVDDLQNNLGTKGIGEPPRIPLAGAISNAIFNATGVRLRDLPMTPDKVLSALEKGGE